MRDWSCLPELILNLIILKLTCLPDCVRFSSVCTLWRRAARNVRRGEKQFPVPMLLGPTINRSGIDKLVLYSVQEKRSYNIHFPFLRHHNARFCGYSFGWLATVETDLSIILFKPSPKDRPEPPVRLPPIVDSFDCPVGLQPRMPHKIFLSDDPTSPQYVVVALYGEFHKLAIWRSWHPNWIFADRSIRRVYDAMWIGHGLYAVNDICHVLQIDGVWKGNNLSGKVVYSGKHLRVNLHIHFIESSSRGLLLIESFLDLISNAVIRDFKVHTLELGPSWSAIMVKDVGGDSLFIGDNCSVAVSSDDMCWDQNNCVYYVNEAADCKHNDKIVCNDMRVFSLETSMCQTHYRPSPSLKTLSPPIWTAWLLSDDWPPIWITPLLSDDWV